MTEAPDLIDGVHGIISPSAGPARQDNKADSALRPTSHTDTPISPISATGLSLYEKLAVSVRVAELSQIETLARHYRAQIANEMPDLATGGRLPAILRYAELTTFYPGKALSADVARLRSLGLTEADIASLSEIIASVAYQARIIDAFGGDE
jgi:uncharacterized protein YciW